MRTLSIALVSLLFSTFAALADVRCIQSFLSDTAFDPGPVDGLWGRKTESALEEFMAQVGASVNGGLGKNNANEVCVFLSGDDREHLAVLGKYRTYPITIDPVRLAAINPNFFDFEQYDIYSGPDLNCGFAFYMDDAFVNRRLWRIDGRLEVISGDLVFGKHAYNVGYDTRPDETVLRDRAELKMIEGGQIVGTMLYYWASVGEGEVGRPPIPVVLSESFEPSYFPPSGETRFAVIGSGSYGALALNCLTLE